MRQEAVLKVKCGSAANNGNQTFDAGGHGQELREESVRVGREVVAVDGAVLRVPARREVYAVHKREISPQLRREIQQNYYFGV